MSYGPHAVRKARPQEATYRCSDPACPGLPWPDTIRKHPCGQRLLLHERYELVRAGLDEAVPGTNSSVDLSRWWQRTCCGCDL